MTSTLTEPRAVSSSSPSMSIVIANVNGPETLLPTLDAIDRLPERDCLEVIVVDFTGGATRKNLSRRSPRVRVVPCAERRSIPRLRHLGVIEAKGDLIAVLEDHTEVGPEWASALTEAHRDPTVAVAGGPVENGRSGLVDRSVFFCEYAPFLGPMSQDGDLAGNNVAFKRDDLLRHAHVLAEGKWESWIVDALKAEGAATAGVPRASIRHIKGFRLGYFLSQRFHFARSFAAMRRTDQSWPRRLVYAAGSAVLPPLLWVRTVRTVKAKGRADRAFLATLPLLAVFFTVGAIGEGIGYLFGAGRSHERVE